MPKLDLTRAQLIKGPWGDTLALKGPGFSWVKPASGPVPYVDEFDGTVNWYLPTGATANTGQYLLDGTNGSPTWGDYPVGAGNLIPVDGGGTYTVEVDVDSVAGSMTMGSQPSYFNENDPVYPDYWVSDGGIDSITINSTGRKLLQTLYIPAGASFVQLTLQPSANATLALARRIVTKTS